jgi:hypothetical protein
MLIDMSHETTRKQPISNKILKKQPDGQAIKNERKISQKEWYEEDPEKFIKTRPSYAYEEFIKKLKEYLEITQEKAPPEDFLNNLLWKIQICFKWIITWIDERVIKIKGEKDFRRLSEELPILTETEKAPESCELLLTEQDDKAIKIQMEHYTSPKEENNAEKQKIDSATSQSEINTIKSEITQKKSASLILPKIKELLENIALGKISPCSTNEKDQIIRNVFIYCSNSEAPLLLDIIKNLDSIEKAQNYVREQAKKVVNSTKNITEQTDSDHDILNELRKKYETYKNEREKEKIQEKLDNGECGIFISAKTQNKLNELNKRIQVIKRERKLEQDKKLKIKNNKKLTEQNIIKRNNEFLAKGTLRLIQKFTQQFYKIKY